MKVKIESWKSVANVQSIVNHELETLEFLKLITGNIIWSISQKENGLEIKADGQITVTLEAANACIIHENS